VARVAVIFTGGTISMRADPVAGGNVPVLDGAAILAQTPGLADVAEVVPIDRGLTPASHFTFPALIELAGIIRQALEDAGTDGAVVVQGTDTIEETAFLFDLLVEGDKPVVVTGAMRSASQAGYDGPANLTDAVRVAASEPMRGQGTVVVLGGSIHAADDVTKTHTSSLTSFQSLNFGPLGEVDGGQVVLARRRAARRRIDTTRAAEPVDLITATVGMDGRLMDGAVASGSVGLVVAATGSGNTSIALLDAASRAIGAGIPVVLASRCLAGRAGGVYAFPGGGAKWLQAGAMLAGHLTGPKARVALALGLGAGFDHDALVDLLADPYD
jgi:L-asparaginase